MKKKNKLLRNQNGAISMFVIVSVLFLTFVLIGIYTSYANKLKAQEEQLGKIQENYGEYASEDGMDELYIAQTQSEEVPLPSEYQQVEYIEARGTEYIDTEYVFKNKPKIIGEIMLTSSGDLDIMGNSSAIEGCFIIDFFGSSLWYRYSSSASTQINTNIETNKWYDFEFSDKVKVDGIEKGTINSYDFSNNNQTFLIGKGRTYGCAKFKDIKMYDGENLVRHFIPCYRKSDGIGGMFDIQNNKFYTNELGTNFYYLTAGNELPNEDSELEYIETTGNQYIDTEYVF